MVSSDLPNNLIQLMLIDKKLDKNKESFDSFFHNFYAKIPLIDLFIHCFIYGLFI